MTSLGADARAGAGAAPSLVNVGSVDTIRIANCSGFYGDRLSAAAEIVNGGPIDFLTGDYLAELTMALLWRGRLKDPARGYASTFETQMEEVLAICLDRGIRVVSNAGGLNPAGLAERIHRIASDRNVNVKLAVVDGDDLVDRIPDLLAAGEGFRHLEDGRLLAEAGIQPVTANAYLGAWGIAAALDAGADVVVTGRVTDASLVMGPAAHHFGWGRTDWDALAGALVVGHILECGAQATGGNYAFFQDVPHLENVGFPIAEMAANGSAVITKHPNTGGLVSVGTVTAQLLYEIAGPDYLNPDVTARFDTIRLEQLGPDRVSVTGAKGHRPPPTTKVAINYLAGFRNHVSFVLPGLDIEEKATLVETAFWRSVGGRERFAESDVRLVRSDRPDPPTNEEACALLTITVKDPGIEKVGRAFSAAAVSLALAHYPGFVLTGPPTDATPYAVYWPAAISPIPTRVTFGERTWYVDPTAGEEPRIPGGGRSTPPSSRAAASGPKVAAPLGRAFGARSGDKGGNANLGVWATNGSGYAWLADEMTVARMKELLPEMRELVVERFEFPNLLALNFVVHGLLGEGVSSSTRADPQAKTLGEYWRAKVAELPANLLSH